MTLGISLNLNVLEMSSANANPGPTLVVGSCFTVIVSTLFGKVSSANMKTVVVFLKDIEVGAYFKSLCSLLKRLGRPTNYFFKSALQTEQCSYIEYNFPNVRYLLLGNSCAFYFFLKWDLFEK